MFPGGKYIILSIDFHTGLWYNEYIKRKETTTMNYSIVNLDRRMARLSPTNSHHTKYQKLRAEGAPLWKLDWVVMFAEAEEKRAR